MMRMFHGVPVEQWEEGVVACDEGGLAYGGSLPTDGLQALKPIVEDNIIDEGESVWINWPDVWLEMAARRREGAG